MVIFRVGRIGCIEVRELTTTESDLDRRSSAEDPESEPPLRERGSRPIPRHRSRPRHGATGWRARRRQRLASRHSRFARHPIGTLLLILVVALTPVWWSFGSAVTNSANGSPSAAAAEWVRGHGGASLVRWIENVWYSHHQPPKGGAPPKGAIPKPVATGTTTNAGVVHLPVPPAIVPFASPAIAGEGQWHPAGPLVKGVPAMYEAFLRPDPVHTSLVAGVVWMDTTLLKATLYSGSYIPGGGPWADTAPVTPSAAQSLVAAFNAGFRMQDAQGGYYTQGQTVFPLKAGGASFVIYANGKATVGAWGTEVKMAPNVVSVRQNLQLLVDNGATVPGLNANDTTAWGLTLGNQVYVWRSGVGVTANGALVYVGGPGLNITTLADLLIRAGAVRGMELDINTDWVNFSTYSPAPGSPASSSNGSTLLSNMSGGPGRYFTGWPRDFVTMSAAP